MNLEIVGDGRPFVNVIDVDGLIARVGSAATGTPEQTLAIARLFSAAPELLAALEAIAEAFDANDSHGIREEIERSRAAITKAKSTT